VSTARAVAVVKLSRGANALRKRNARKVMVAARWKGVVINVVHVPVRLEEYLNRISGSHIC